MSYDKSLVLASFPIRPHTTAFVQLCRQMLLCTEIDTQSVPLWRSYTCGCQTRVLRQKSTSSCLMKPIISPCPRCNHFTYQCTSATSISLLTFKGIHHTVHSGSTAYYPTISYSNQRPQLVLASAYSSSLKNGLTSRFQTFT